MRPDLMEPASLRQHLQIVIIQATEADTDARDGFFPTFPDNGSALFSVEGSVDDDFISGIAIQMPLHSGDVRSQRGMGPELFGKMCSSAAMARQGNHAAGGNV